MIVQSKIEQCAARRNFRRQRRGREGTHPFGWNGLYCPPLQDNEYCSPILLGPIIGTVTHNSARILIETRVSQAITCVVISQNPKTGEKVSEKAIRLTVEAYTPTIFHFQELLEGIVTIGLFACVLTCLCVTASFYVVIVDPVPPMLASSSFRTAPRTVAKKPLHVTVINNRGSSVASDNAKQHLDHTTDGDRETTGPTKACTREPGIGTPPNSTTEDANPETSFWKTLYKDVVRGSTDVLLHIGVPNVSVQERVEVLESIYDQIVIEGYSPMQYEIIFEIVQTLYHKLFSENLWLKHLLANTSNVAIYTEEDVFFTPELLECYPFTSQQKQSILLCCFALHQAYWGRLNGGGLEYYDSPSSLFFDISVINTPALSLTCVADVSILILDTVSSRWIKPRTEKNNEFIEESVLGAKQWRLLDQLLMEDTGLSETKHLIVGSSDAITDRHSSWWRSTTTQMETEQLVTKLFDWIEAAPAAHRSVTLISSARERLKSLCSLGSDSTYAADIIRVGCAKLYGYAIRELCVGSCSNRLQQPSAASSPSAGAPSSQCVVLPIVYATGTSSLTMVSSPPVEFSASLCTASQETVGNTKKNEFTVRGNLDKKQHEARARSNIASTSRKSGVLSARHRKTAESNERKSNVGRLNIGAYAVTLSPTGLMTKVRLPQRPRQRKTPSRLLLASSGISTGQNAGTYSFNMTNATELTVKDSTGSVYGGTKLSNTLQQETLVVAKFKFVPKLHHLRLTLLASLVVPEHPEEANYELEGRKEYVAHPVYNVGVVTKKSNNDLVSERLTPTTLHRVVYSPTLCGHSLRLTLPHPSADRVYPSVQEETVIHIRKKWLTLDRLKSNDVKTLI